MKKSDILYLVITVLFCVNLVVTNIVSVKLFYIPIFSGMALPIGEITYPITFLITDIVSEVWGKARAQLIVLLGLVMNIFMFLMVMIAVYLPPHESWTVPGAMYGFTNADMYQNAYESVFCVSGVLVFASMVTYLISQMIDIGLFHRLKVLTKGRHLWLRNNGSTMTAQLVDTLVFNIIFLWWGLGLDAASCLEIIFLSYCFRFFLALGDTPFFYLGVHFIKKLIKREEMTLQYAN